MRKGNIRIVGLDYFRIGLAILVFLFHSRNHISCSYGFLNSFIEMGAIAMTGFFMLSGFVLFDSYGYRSFAVNGYLKTFFYKRFAMIWPSFAVVSIMSLFFSEGTAIKKMVFLPVEMSGLSTVFTSLFDFGPVGGTWFISCLGFCYLLFPCFCYLIRLMGGGGKVLCTVIIVSLLLYSPIVVKVFHLANIYSNPFFRVLEFCVGMLLSDFLHFCCVREKMQRMCPGIISILVVVGLIFIVTVARRFGISGGGYLNTFMLYSWIALPSFAVLICCLSVARLHDRQIIRWCSEYSFTFFLAQLFTWQLFGLLPTDLTSRNELKILVSFFICLSIAIALRHIVQIPVRRKLLSLSSV